MEENLRTPKGQEEFEEKHCRCIVCSSNTLPKRLGSLRTTGPDLKDVQIQYAYTVCTRCLDGRAIDKKGNPTEPLISPSGNWILWPDGSQWSNLPDKDKSSDPSILCTVHTSLKINMDPL